MLVKILGIVDILAAVFLFMADLGVLNPIKFVLIAVLLIKAVPSLLG